MHLLVGAHHQRREVVLLLGEPARDRACRSARCRRTPRPRGSRACASESLPSASAQLLRAPRRSSPGSTTTAANAKFFAAARIIVGPPMSMFSITSCSVDAAAARRSPRTDRGSRTPGRRTRSRARSAAAMCAGVVAQREQARVELRVQRLDAPVHDLREAREVLDRADLEARPRAARARCRRWRRARRRARRARARTRRSPVLSDTDSSARRIAHLARLRHRPPSVADDTWSASATATSTRRGLAGSSATAPRGDQPDRLGQQLVLDRAQRVADLLGVGGVRAARPRAGG